MGVVVMRKLFISSAWRRAFADTLIRLRPEMNPDAADELSDTAWDTMSALPPIDAAQSYIDGVSVPPVEPRNRSLAEE